MFGKKTTKVLAIIISMVLIIVTLPLSGIVSFAAEVVVTIIDVGDFRYVPYGGSYTAKVLGFTDEVKAAGKTAVDIPEKIYYGEKWYTVTEIDNSAFSEYSVSSDIEYPIKSVTLPDTMEYIGRNAFRYCKSLETVTFGNSLRTIGEGAFNFCESLKEVDLPDSIVTIESFAFDRCNSVNSITLGSELKTIGDFAFRDTAITSIVIPDKVEIIGDEVFRTCTLLETVVISDSVKEIGSLAFRQCYALKNLTMGKNVEIIGYEAFLECTSLTSLTLPSTLRDMSYRTFYNCSRLETVDIEYGIEKIGDASFQHCGSLKSVNIPNSVTAIGNDAFAACRKLSSVQMGENVETIGDYAFSSCEALISIDLPSKLKVINKLAFNYCSSLKEVSLPSGLERIEGEAFKKTAITSIDIPNTVTFIGGSAFAGCGELITANIPYGITSIEPDTFGGCKKLASIRIPASVQNIGNHAFSECESLQEITIPGSVSLINYDAFAKCKKLSSVTILDGVEKIHYRAFENCTELKTVKIPSSVTSITDDAFRGSDSVVLIVSPASYAVDYAKKYKLTYKFDCKPVSITDVTLPEKTVYPIGGEIDFDNIKITALFENGKTEDVTDFCILDGYDMYTPGVQQVSVIYDRFTVPFEVTVDKDLIEYPESDHNYANDFEKIWKYNHRYPAEKLNIKFSEKTETEGFSDKIYIYNEDGSNVGVYYGTNLSGKTVTVTGRSFTIKLASDGSGSRYGFSIDYIEIACDHKRTATTTPATYTSPEIRTSCCEACDSEEVIPCGHALCDFNKDGKVDATDYDAFDSSTADLQVFDFDTNGTVTDFDLTVIRHLTNKTELKAIGDVNGDGTSNLKDVVRAKKIMAGYDVTGDINRNFDDTADARDLVFIADFAICYLFGKR